jgi:hypothetical protein
LDAAKAAETRVGAAALVGVAGLVKEELASLGTER